MNNWRTIVVSDIHLGSKYSRAKEVNKFLKENKAETLILNGDIIDGWALKRGGVWNDDHMKVVRRIMKISKKTKVYWVRGNHDDFLYDFIPFKLGKISIVENLSYKGIDGNEYLVLHGDIFDVFVNDMKWLAKLGSIGYDFCLWLNKWYNRWRAFRGKKYFSLSQKIKDSVKTATSFIGQFESHMVSHANMLLYQGVICGHIHKAEIKKIGEIVYMNSGDWVESKTALVEDFDGNWKLIYF